MTETATRDRILEVARNLFAQRGFRGTTVRHITAAAQVNVAAIGYWFESKEGLYREVLTSLIGPMAERVDAAARSPSPPLDRIEFIVRSLFEHIRQHPQMPGLMVREMAGAGAGGAVNQVLVEMFGRLLPKVAAIVVEGQRDGWIRQGDPTLLVLSIVSQPVYMNLARPLISRVAGLDPSDEATSRRMADHAVAVIRAGLAAPAHGEPGSTGPQDAPPVVPTLVPTPEPAR